MSESMWLSRPSRAREHRGPFPHSVLIMGRPVDPDVYERELIRRRKVDRLIDEDERGAELDALQKKLELRNEFTKLTDRKVRANVARSKVKEHMHIYELGVQQRRERLKQLLGAEDENYRVECLSLEETLAHRMERNRQKIKEYRDFKEAERLRFVQDKLMQQMAEESDDVRSLVSKKLLLEAAADRVEQMNVKAANRKAEKQVNDLYFQLGQVDWEARKRREELEAQDILRRNCEQVSVLQKQAAAKEEKRRTERKMLEEEKQFLTEQRRLWAAEAEEVEREKERQKTDLRRLYDRMLRSNHERRTNELKAELVFDMKLTERHLQETSNEEYERIMNKRATKEETLKYLAFLRTLRAEEAEEQKRVDEVVDCEVRLAQEKQDRVWRLEREARHRLMCDSAQAINKQRQLKAVEKEEEKARNRALDKAIEMGVEELKRVDEERERKRQEEDCEYGRDLCQQIEYNRRQRQMEMEERARMLEKQTEEEREYQARMADLLCDPRFINTHPGRLKLCREMQTRNHHPHPQQQQQQQHPPQQQQVEAKGQC